VCGCSYARSCGSGGPGPRGRLPDTRDTPPPREVAPATQPLPAEPPGARRAYPRRQPSGGRGVSCGDGTGLPKVCTRPDDRRAESEEHGDLVRASRSRQSCRWSLAIRPRAHRDVSRSLRRGPLLSATNHRLTGGQGGIARTGAAPSLASTDVHRGPDTAKAGGRVRSMAQAGRQRFSPQQPAAPRAGGPRGKSQPRRGKRGSTAAGALQVEA